MLIPGLSTPVTFNVNVMGSSAEPKVRLLLDTQPQLAFKATHQDTDTWLADLTLPSSVQPGSYELCVEVLLNDRLFTPLRKIVNIGDAVQPATFAPDIQPEPVSEPVVPEPELPEPEPMVVVAKMPEVRLKVEGSLLSQLENIAAKSVKRRYNWVDTKLPKEALIPTALHISMSDVDALAPLSEAKLKPVKVVKSKPTSMIRLVKEDLFYQ